MAPLGVSFHLLIEDQGLVFSAFLIPFDSNFLCVLGLCHSLKSCALPLSFLLHFEHSLALPFFGIEMKRDLFLSYDRCCIF